MILGQRTLNIEIESFQLTLDLFPDDPEITGRSLILTGTTGNAHFLSPRECCMEIWETKDEIDYRSKNDDNGEPFFEYGQIANMEWDSENDINAFVNPVFGLTTKPFENLINLLEGLKESVINASLSLYGLKLGILSIEDDQWPERKLLSIIGVEFETTRKKNV